MTGPFNSLVDIFNGNQINPSNSSYQSIELTALNSPYVLQWPLIGVQAGQIVTNIIEVTADAIDLEIKLPDATLASVGQIIRFFNIGSNEFNVLNFSGGVVANVPVANNTPPTPPSSGAIYIYLRDNTTQAGEWGVISAGALTGAIQASLLAGNGLVVGGSKLETSLEVESTLGPTYNVTPNNSSPNASDRARFIIWAGGSGTINFPPVALAGADFFFAIGNQTANGASILLQTPDGALIDGEPSTILGDGQTAIWATDGLNWFSLGLGTPSFFNTTVLVKDLSPIGGGTLTLSSDESNRTIIYFVTNTTPLTSNITILFTASPRFNFITNNITNNGFTLSVAANGGAEVTLIPVGETFIFMNDGIEMFPVPTSVAAGSIIFPDGSAGFPSIRYVGAPSSGGFLAGPNELGWSINGNQIIGIDAFGINMYTNGTLTEPVFNYVGAPGGTGTYLNTVSNYVGHTYSGVLGAAIGNGFLGLANGTSVSPSLVFVSDDITGIYKAGTGAIGFASESAEVAVIDALGIATINGVATNPSYSFLSDAISGMYSPALHTVGFATNGILTATITTTGLELLSNAGVATKLSLENPAGTHFTTFVSGAIIADNNYTLPTAYPTVSGYVLASTTTGVMSWVDSSTPTSISLADGTAGAPSLSFVTQPDTGMYLVAADEIGFSAGGFAMISIGPIGLTLQNTVNLTFINGANSFVLDSLFVSNDQKYFLPPAYPTVSGQPLIASAGINSPMSWATSSFDANGIKVPNGVAATPSFSFTSVPNTGMYLNGTSLQLVSSGNQIARASNSSTGFIINTGFDLVFENGGSFSTRLQSGTLTANTTYVLPIAYPAASGQPMISTTGGTMSWAANALFDTNGMTIAATKSLFLTNPANTFTTSFTSGAVTGNTPYTLPTAYPTVSNQTLTSTTAGVMSWQNFLPQVLQTSVGTQQTIAITANTFADVTGLAQTITLQSTSSRVLVSVVMHVSGPNATVQDIFMRVQRNGSTIGVGTPSGSQIACGSSVHAANNEGMTPLIYSYIDSPASVAALTYQIQVSLDATANFYLNRDVNDTGTSTYQTPISTITLTELLV